MVVLQLRTARQHTTSFRHQLFELLHVLCRVLHVKVVVVKLFAGLT